MGRSAHSCLLYQLEVHAVLEHQVAAGRADAGALGIAPERWWVYWSDRSPQLGQCRRSASNARLSRRSKLINRLDQHRSSASARSWPAPHAANGGSLDAQLGGQHSDGEFDGVAVAGRPQAVVQPPDKRTYIGATAA